MAVAVALAVTVAVGVRVRALLLHCCYQGRFRGRVLRLVPACLSREAAEAAKREAEGGAGETTNAKGKPESARDRRRRRRAQR